MKEYLLGELEKINFSMPKRKESKSDCVEVVRGQRSNCRTLIFPPLVHALAGCQPRFHGASFIVVVVVLKPLSFFSCRTSLQENQTLQFEKAKLEKELSVLKQELEVYSALPDVKGAVSHTPISRSLTREKNDQYESSLHRGSRSFQRSEQESSIPQSGPQMSSSWKWECFALEKIHPSFVMRGRDTFGGQDDSKGRGENQGHLSM